MKRHRWTMKKKILTDGQFEIHESDGNTENKVEIHFVEIIFENTDINNICYGNGIENHAPKVVYFYHRQYRDEI